MRSRLHPPSPLWGGVGVVVLMRSVAASIFLLHPHPAAFARRLAQASTLPKGGRVGTSGEPYAIALTQEGDASFAGS